jgi:hypothetical protein
VKINATKVLVVDDHNLAFWKMIIFFVKKGGFFLERAQAPNKKVVQKNL